MKQQKTLYDRLIARIKNNTVAATVIVLGTIVIALATFTGAMKNLVNLIAKKGPEVARVELSQMSLEYTPEAFVGSAEKGDMAAVKLFLAAGMDPQTRQTRKVTQPLCTRLEVIPRSLTFC
jgi:hypothetical protein